VTRLIVGVGALAAVLLAPVLAVVTLVVPAWSSTSAAPVACVGYGADLPRILATIRTVETGGNYTTTITTSSASGAYAFIDTAWRHYAHLAGIDAKTYPRAKDAPPELQDQTAAYYADALLERNGGRVSSVPISWYLGHEPAPDSPEWDTLPPGNAITPRSYVDKWMRVYADLVLGAEVPNEFCNGITGADAKAGDPLNPLVDDSGRAWSIPVSPSAFDPSQLDDPHHDYPAWDLMIAVGTPVYALTAGTVTRVTRFAQNWWGAGCTTARPGGCQSCGMGITVHTDIGLRYTYCHNTDVFVDEGQQVTAGQQVAVSGDTGYSGAPHVHIEFHLNGVQYCPQPMMQALYSGRIGPITWTTRDCSF
jgi:Peptidase family M23